MRLREPRPGVVELTATRAEASVLVAAARMALDLLAADPASPEAARRALTTVIRDYDAACGRIHAPAAAPERT